MSVVAFSVWIVKIGSSALNAKIFPAWHVRIHYGVSFATKAFVVTAKREFIVPFVENHLAPSVKW
jgi:hypothetical protein